jgi:hypothetical protein
MTYEIRPARASEWSILSRWIVHDAGFPNTVRAETITRFGARRLARRWERRDAAAQRSEAV